MAAVAASASFRRFEEEANRFQIRPAGANDLRFDAKQRMIARAAGFAIREAYGIPWWKMLVPGTLSPFSEGMRRCDEKLEAAEGRATNPVKLDGDDDRHRAEICLNLYARTLQQIIQRRLYMVAAVAAVAAAVASVAAISPAAFELIRMAVGG